LLPLLLLLLFLGTAPRNPHDPFPSFIARLALLAILLCVNIAPCLIAPYTYGPGTQLAADETAWQPPKNFICFAAYVR
jgi:hypothetical protein